MINDQWIDIPPHMAKRVAGECAIIFFEAAGDTLIDMASDGLGWMFEKLFPSSKGNKYLNQFTTNLRFGASSRANLLVMSNANKFMEEQVRQPIEDEIKTKKIKVDSLNQAAYLTQVRDDLKEKYPDYDDKKIDKIAAQSLAYTNVYTRNKKKELDQEGSNAINRCTESQNAAHNEARTYGTSVGTCQTGYDTGTIADKDTSIVNFKSPDINKLLNGTGYFDRG